MDSINWLAVLAAAATGFLVGGIWYGPLFGKAWMSVTGITEEQAKSANLVKVYGFTYVLNVIAAFALVMYLGPERTWQMGLFYGAITGAAFVGTALGITYLFENRPLKHFFINAGYQTLNFAAMGVVLGAWR